MFNESITEKNYYNNENVTKLTPELREAWDTMFACKDRIELILRSRPIVANKGFWGQPVETPIAAYLLAIASKYNNPMTVSYETVIKEIDDSVIASVAYSFDVQSVWKELLLLTKDYDGRTFLLVSKLQNLSNPERTPDSIRDLAIELLQPSKGDKVADLCCGTGSVSYAIGQNKSLTVVGYDISEENVAIAKVNNPNEENVFFEKKDVFELGLKERVIKYNKIFANYPFGMRLKDLFAGKDYLELITKRISSISKVTSSDWLYSMLVTDLLESGGRAVCLMTNGSTWNSIDAPIRKYFVENGLIESVITLPTKIFVNTGVATSLIVFSQNNKGVRIVDASECYVAGRRVNELSEENISTILNMLKNDGEKSCLISIEQLRENDYVLNLSRYLGAAEDMPDYSKFESVIKRITRGASLNANELDKLSSPVPTDSQYLMLSNIQNGLIDNNLPYIKEIEKKNEKYCLTNRCLILSKNGYPYKIAVAEINEGQKILANGNLYIIEIDEEKADPYYLAAFFSSELGIAALKRITVGAAIPNIGVDSLKNLLLPIPELEKQREIGEKYKSLKTEIVMLQLKLEKTKDKLTHIFQEGGGK